MSRTPGLRGEISCLPPVGTNGALHDECRSQA
jgi:hypothetical protein